MYYVHSVNKLIVTAKLQQPFQTTKSFSRNVYTTFYTLNQICCAAERKTALQISAEPLSNTSKNNTSLITSLPYLYVHSTKLYKKKRHNLSFGAERICKQQKIQREWIQVRKKRMKKGNG